MQRINNAFSKWFIVWKGRNNLPTDHAWYLQNVRIKNWGITNKKGARKLHEATHHVQAIFWYDLDNRLYYIRDATLIRFPNSSLWNLFIAAWDKLWWTNPRRIVKYWDFVLMLNWRSHMRVFHLEHWLFRVDNASWYESWPSILPLWISDWVWVRMPDPIIWCTITWFTLIAGSNTVTRNILYISHPVSYVEPYNSYNFSIPSWWQEYDIWENRHMSSEILGMVSTGNNAYIFCKDSIEIIGRDTMSIAWSIATLSTIRIWTGEQLLSHRTAVAVWEQVFFFTRQRTICSINYTPGIEDPNIDLHFSDSINEWLKLNIVQWSQRNAFAYYDKKEEQVEFHLHSIFETENYPDIVVIRDIKSQTRLIDKDMAFQDLCIWWATWQTTYAAQGKFIYEDNANTYNNYYQDNSWTNQWIEARYHTTNIAMGNETQEKLFKWFTIAWWMTMWNKIIVRCFIDWKLEFSKEISSFDIASSELSAIDTWDPVNYSQTNKLYPFEYVADQWKIRKKWKRIRIAVECSEINEQFYVDTLFIDAVPTWNFELNDKF